jgi:hypothetical protein
LSTQLPFRDAGGSVPKTEVVIKSHKIIAVCSSVAAKPGQTLPDHQYRLSEASKKLITIIIIIIRELWKIQTLCKWGDQRLYLPNFSHIVYALMASKDFFSISSPHTARQLIPRGWPPCNQIGRRA